MPALTRLNIQTMIGDLINDPNNTQWSTSQVQDQIQHSMEQFVEDTKALTDTQSFSVVSGTNTYDLSNDTLDIIRVAHNGLALARRGKFDLDIEQVADWSITQGTPRSYYVDFTSTNTNLTVFPIPQSGDAGTNNLIVEYVKVPPTLSSDSDEPLNSQPLLRPYLMAIVYNAAAYFLGASTNPVDWQKSDRLIAAYADLVYKCQEIFNQLSQTKSPRMRGGRYFFGL